MNSRQMVRRFVPCVAMMQALWCLTACQSFTNTTAMDIRPHQPWARQIAQREVAAAGQGGGSMRQLPARATRRAVQAIAADIEDFAGSALTQGRSSQLMDNRDLVNRMTSVQRTAQLLINDDVRDSTGIASNGAALFTALVDAEYGVARFAARPGLRLQDRHALDQLASWLRARSTGVGAVLMPLSGSGFFDVSTPERKAAMSALDLVVKARADESLIGSRPHISLAAGIDGVERAAQSFLLGGDQGRAGAWMKMVALSTTMLLTDRVATNIAGRDNEPELTRARSADLAGALREILTQLGVKAPAPDEQFRNASQWSWWDQVPAVERL